MHQLNIPVTAAQADLLEAHFCEDYQEHWMLFENEKLKTHELRGYFADEAEAAAGYAALRDVFAELPELEAESGRVLEDTEWKDAYKLHFKPWSDRGLHFVPEWERASYALPAGEEIILLDPGMAFGTGNHETTRLCIHRLLDVREAWQGEVAEKSVIDAGCGSGILAIAAVKAGFGGEVFAFDNDPDSVRIAGENAELCEVAGRIEYCWCDLLEGLADRSADVLLANILAPVLTAHSGLLLGAVAPGGALILSGILAEEVAGVAAHFEAEAKAVWGSDGGPATHVDGQWADVLMWRPV
ncbi:MAG: 50S ribosomal protein L11 methyltransferase [Verrucomicrobiota bacterium]